jgi:hypothetical protein
MRKATLSFLILGPEILEDRQARNRAAPGRRGDDSRKNSDMLISTLNKPEAPCDSQVSFSKEDVGRWEDLALEMRDPVGNLLYSESENVKNKSLFSDSRS